MGRKKKASVAETEGKKGRDDHKAGILKTLFKSAEGVQKFWKEAVKFWNTYSSPLFFKY